MEPVEVRVTWSRRSVITPSTYWPTSRRWQTWDRGSARRALRGVRRGARRKKTVVVVVAAPHELGASRRRAAGGPPAPAGRGLQVYQASRRGAGRGARMRRPVVAPVICSSHATKPAPSGGCRPPFLTQSSAPPPFLMCHLRGRDPQVDHRGESLPNGRRTPARASPPSRCTTPGPCAAISFSRALPISSPRCRSTIDGVYRAVPRPLHCSLLRVLLRLFCVETAFFFAADIVKLGHRRFARGSGVSLMLSPTRHRVTASRIEQGRRRRRTGHADVSPTIFGVRGWR